MITINPFIQGFSSIFPDKNPWEIIIYLEDYIKNMLLKLPNEYTINNNIAIHKDAIVEEGAILKGNIIIDEFTRIGANAYLRGPIYIGKNVNIGPGVEIKQSIIFDNTAVAHFNYIGNSIIGNNINFEAGSIVANHYNERENKIISVKFQNTIISTNTNKFGALVGDNTKIGANAVLSPGTILEKNSVVKRLELIEQLPYK